MDLKTTPHPSPPHRPLWEDNPTYLKNANPIFEKEKVCV